MQHFEPLNPDHFLAFCYYHLLPQLKYPIPGFHKELIQLTRYPRVAIAAPRKFAKSTYFSVYYALFFALEKPGSTITLVSASHGMACEWIDRIRKILEESSTIRDFYGEQSPKMVNETGKWTQDSLELRNGSKLRGRGSGQALRGGENHLIILDDLETDETVASPDQTKALTNWFKTVVLGSTMPWSQVIVVGTILHPDSLLNSLIHEPLTDDWQTRLYRAVKEDGTSLWEQMWSIEYLHKRRQEMSDDLFEQEYQNNPIPDAQRKFPPTCIQYFDHEPAGCVYFVAADAGNKLGPKSDPTAIVTVAVDSDHNWYVVDVVNKRMNPSETIGKIFELYDRYQFASAGLESVVFETTYEREMQYQKQQRKKYPIFVELKHGNRRKEMRIEALQPRFQSNKIFIRADQEELKLQLLRFPSLYGHDDIIDALAYIMDIYRPASGKEAKRLNPMSFDAQLQRAHEQGDEGKTYWGNQFIHLQ